MKVRLRVNLTGTRNGEAWPPKGAEMELPEAEAQDMIRGGMAEAITDFHEDPRPMPTAREHLVPMRMIRP